MPIAFDVDASNFSSKLTKDFAFSHVYFEMNGKREVCVDDVVAQSAQLWIERAQSLGEVGFAALQSYISQLMDGDVPQSKCSSIDYLRLAIIDNALRPNHLASKAPYPHKDLLIAGVMIEEARRRSASRDESVWHVIAIANLYLGHALRATQTEIKAEQGRRATLDEDDDILQLVLAAMVWLRKQSSWQRRGGSLALLTTTLTNKKIGWLKILQRVLPSKTEGGVHQDSATRLASKLEKWTTRGCPYQIFQDAMRHFLGKSTAEEADSFFDALEHEERMHGGAKPDTNLVSRMVYSEDKQFDLIHYQEPDND